MKRTPQEEVLMLRKALRKCVGVLAGTDLNKNALVDALVAGRDALGEPKTVKLAPTPEETADYIDTIARWHAVLRVNTQGGQGVAARSEAPASVKFPEAAHQYEVAIASLGWYATNLPHAVAVRAFNNIPALVWGHRREVLGNPPLWSTARAMRVAKAIRDKTDAYAKIPGRYGNAASSMILNAGRVYVRFSEAVP